MFVRNAQVIIGLICITYVKETMLAPRDRCDLTPNAWFSEGNMGEAGVFPWLGILRVHLHDSNTLKIALTGLVLVRDKYAIANADDVTRIPRKIFKEDSKAMFIATDQEPWYCNLKDYMTHPEYEFSTFNTIALLELDLGEELFGPVKPICLPPYSFNTSNQLYALGYTDENKLLEKTLYKLQYVNPTLCEEFYNRAGLVEGKMMPTHYVCGYAANNRENCVWDNGMVLASNSSGVWNLIGFGLHGPGCAAPARFIDMIPYLSWIESATSLYESDAYPDFRKKSAFSEGFNTLLDSDIEDIPVHRLFTGGRRIDDRLKNDYLKYPFDTEGHQNRYFSINRIDKDAIMITKIADMHGKCSDYKTTVFHEETKVVGNQFLSGVATYRLSMYDWHVSNYTCIIIKVKCTNKEQAKLYYNTYLDRKEGAAAGKLGDFGDTPEQLLKTFPITPVSDMYKKKTQDLSNGTWQPGPNLKPIFVEDDIGIQNVTNVNLLLKFEFKGEGSMKIQLYGPPMAPTTTTPVPWHEKTTTMKARRIGPKIGHRRTYHVPVVNNEEVVISSKDRVDAFSLITGVFIAYLLVTGI